jgi:hypothetical protein
MKAYFFSRLLREKLLLTAFVLLAALTWLSSAGHRWLQLTRDWKAVSVQLADQRLWLAKRADIEAQAKSAIEHLDPAKTLDGARLVGELNTLAGQSGLTSTASDDVRTDRTAQFAVNSVQFTVRRTDLASLLNFYEALAKRSPYLGLEQFSVVADRANPALLSATLRVSSVEVMK